MTINFVTVNQSDKLLTQIKGLSARVFPYVLVELVDVIMF